FRIEITEVHDLAHLHDRAFRSGGHDRPEVARRFAIDEIAPAIRAQRLDQREVRFDRILEHVIATVDLARLLAFCEQRYITGRREERADTGSRGANALGKISLR